MSYATSTLAADIRSAGHKERIKILRTANRSNYLLLHHIDRLSVKLQSHQIWYRHLENKHHGIEDSINHLQRLHENGCFTEGWSLPQEEHTGEHRLTWSLTWSPPQEEHTEEHGLKVLTECLGLACDSLDAEIKLFLLNTGATYRI